MEAIGKDPSLPNIQINEKKQATRNADRVKVPAQQLIDQELNGPDLSNEQREKLVICRQALELLRDDTAHEVLYVFSARKSAQRSSTININFSSRGKAEVEQVMSTIGKPEVLFLLVANTFNKLDDQGEKAIAANIRSDSAAVGADFLQAMLVNAKISEYRGEDGAMVRVTFRKMVESVKFLAQRWGIDPDERNWDEYIGKILAGQKEGMELIAQTRLAGKISYSVEDALDYRKRTIGSYTKLLTSLGITENQNSKTTFKLQLVGLQYTDDMQDIFEDAFSQVNPFLAKIQELGLFDKFLYFRKTNYSSKNSSEMLTGNFIKSLDPKVGILVKNEFASLKTKYATLAD